MASSSASKKKKKNEDAPLIKTLSLVDPLLQFLTKRSGKTSVPLKLLHSMLKDHLSQNQYLLAFISELDDLGIIQLHCESNKKPATISWDDKIEIGFPSPENQTTKEAGSLSGSTKTAARRRVAALKQILKQRIGRQPGADSSTSTSLSMIENDENNDEQSDSRPELQKDWDPDSHKASDELEELCHEGKHALEELQKMFRFAKQPSRGKGQLQSKNSIPNSILPRQAAYSGSHPSQNAGFGELPPDVRKKIPDVILQAFGISNSRSIGRRLYSHQAKAISSLVREKHTLVSTSTGSGKSLCFLIPALAAAYNASVNCGDDITAGISLIMFPTKALAQDQLMKLKTLLSKSEQLERHIHVATLDGDCPHDQRAYIAKNANVILTNPDTVHAALLSSWDKLYKRLFSKLKYVVIDESHIYEGLFGTHVALILSRLQRLCVAAGADSSSFRTPTYCATSATLDWPEYHIRLLCPIPSSSEVTLLTGVDDGSPRAAKHFFVWNPPLLTSSGESTGSVFHPKAPSKAPGKAGACTGHGRGISTKKRKLDRKANRLPPNNAGTQNSIDRGNQMGPMMNSLHRRHAADETALLLARAVANNVRCIAFCKTRSVVEWVYERTVAVLRSDSATRHLADRVEPYRGGYQLETRREIEKKLFDKELIGVVATCALELGVDIGGIELTLHVGYPNITSLLQQAGRAGRSAPEKPSLSIVVCFGSPSEQFLWKHPSALLRRGISSPRSFPINAGVVQGHLLCASKEYPLTGKFPVSVLCSTPGDADQSPLLLPDQELFGSKDTYAEAVRGLCSNGSVVRSLTSIASGREIFIHKAHASIDKPWLKVSIRSVEPVSFSIVDISHPGQGGRLEGIHDQQAILDTLPYSRVFYHAYPGAIILHRGTKYKVLSMTRPPPYDPCMVWRRNLNLAAFVAKSTMDKYMTRPLSTNTITIVKQIERVDVKSPAKPEQSESPTSVVDAYAALPDQTEGSFAGCGVVTSKRTVHGYKKLSLITRAELSRHDLSLPAMEYDTFGLWLDTEAETLGPFLGSDYGSGVHALSHALLAVAPLFIACVRSDLECDHSSFSPTRVCLFDERAGGSGTCAELWKSLFIPNGLLEAAVDLLENCSSCCQQNNDIGCPACLQSGECIKFNQFLSRSAALVIGKRMLKRVHQSDLYKSNSEQNTESANQDGTPRKKARNLALRNAKDIESAKSRLFVVGRPSWPTDEDTMPGQRQENGE